MAGVSPHRGASWQPAKIAAASKQTPNLDTIY